MLVKDLHSPNINYAYKRIKFTIAYLQEGEYNKRQDVEDPLVPSYRKVPEVDNKEGRDVKENGDNPECANC